MNKRRKIIFGAFTGLASCALLGTASGACAMISNNRQVELKNLQSSTNQLEQAQAQINQLKSQCETYQAQIQKMSEQLNNSSSTSSSTDTKKEPSGDKTLTPSGDITPWLEEKLKSLTSYLDKIKQDLTTAQNTINQQQEANKKLQQSLTNATATQQITESQYQDSQNTISNLQTQIKDLQEKLQNANAQINSFNFDDISMYQINAQLVSPYALPFAYKSIQSGTAIDGANGTGNNSITNPIPITINVPLAIAAKLGHIRQYYFGALNLTATGLNGSAATIPNAGVVLVNPNMTQAQIQQAIKTQFGYNSNGTEGGLSGFPLYFTLMPSSYLASVGSGNNQYTYANPPVDSSNTSIYQADSNNDPIFKAPFSNVEPSEQPTSTTQGTYAWFLGSSMGGAQYNTINGSCLGSQVAVGTVDLAKTNSITFEICAVSQDGSWFGAPYMFYQITINITAPIVA